MVQPAHIDVPIIRGNFFTWRMRFQEPDPGGAFPLPDFANRNVEFRALWPSGSLRKTSQGSSGGIVKTNLATAEAELYLTHVETRSLPVLPYAAYELWLKWTDILGRKIVRVYGQGRLIASQGINDDRFDPIISLGDKLKAWWHAEDVADGPVASWTDRKASFAVTTGTSTFQPIKSAGWLSFDGVDDRLAASSLGPLPSGTAGSMILASIDQTDMTSIAAVRAIFSYGQGGSAGRAILRRGDVIASNFSARTNVDSSATGVVDSDPGFTGVHICAGGFSANTVSGRRDGRDTIPASVSTTVNTSGARTRMGCSLEANPLRFHKGRIRQVFVTTNLTMDELLKMEGYLAWDIPPLGQPDLLPADHPYRFAPPNA